MPGSKTLLIPMLLLCWALPPAAGSDFGCSEQSVMASVVSTRDDVKAFVRCAHEFATAVGTDEARRAFHEDVRWRSGQVYVFVLEAIPSAAEATIIVNPPNAHREGGVWGALPDLFGDDIVREGARIIRSNGSGWWYYAFPNPASGNIEPKASYIMAIDWDGMSAMIGAGIYERDRPGSCNADDVNARVLAGDPGRVRLLEFVRCAALLVESEGYFAKAALEEDARWSDSSIYAYVMDMAGNQVLSGRRFRVNGAAAHEWGGRSSPHNQFGGRDMSGVGDTFGEAFIYYRSVHPVSGELRDKVGLLKRVVAQGVPLLVGAGYYVD